MDCGALKRMVRPAAGDPWNLAAEDVAAAWRTVGDHLSETSGTRRDEAEPVPPRSRPLPSPAELEAYAAHGAETVDSIVSMAETTLAHQQEAERQTAKRSFLGVMTCLVATVLFAGVAMWLMLSGLDLLAAATSAALLGFLTVAVLASYRSGRVTRQGSPRRL